MTGIDYMSIVDVLLLILIVQLFYKTTKLTLKWPK